MSEYLRTVAEVYAEAARQPDAELCCTSSPLWYLPDLRIPRAMLEMNYGYGSTVPGDAGEHRSRRVQGP